MSISSWRTAQSMAVVPSGSATFTSAFCCRSVRAVARSPDLTASTRRAPALPVAAAKHDAAQRKTPAIRRKWLLTAPSRSRFGKVDADSEAVAQARFIILLEVFEDAGAVAQGVHGNAGFVKHGQQEIGHRCV